jgi:hypothetical protein
MTMPWLSEFKYQSTQNVNRILYYKFDRLVRTFWNTKKFTPLPGSDIYVIHTILKMKSGYNPKQLRRTGACNEHGQCYLC